MNFGMKENVCCFSGHRPEKIFVNEASIKERIESSVLNAIDINYTSFVCGMARGFDIWAGEVVLKLKHLGYPIKLICSAPFAGFENSWNQDWQHRYQTLIENSDERIYVNDHYYKNCFLMRNKWMVDHSSRVIAYFDGSNGGTRHTIKYAGQQGLYIVNLYN